MCSAEFAADRSGEGLRRARIGKKSVGKDLQLRPVEARCEHLMPIEPDKATDGPDTAFKLRAILLPRSPLGFAGGMVAVSVQVQDLRRKTSLSKPPCRLFIA